MARIISNRDAESLPTTALRMQAYSALDVCLTFGVHQALQKELAKSEDARRVYRFERAMQGPALAMALRGIAVDEAECKRQVAALEADEERLRRAIDRFAQAWGMPGCNPNSPVQVAALLYDACGEAAYHTHEGTVTTGEEKLLMLQARSPLIGTIAHTILECRAIRKAQGFLKARRSPDGRLRSSFNVGATTSGRWSFSKDAFGDGLNFGNIPKSRRSMFVPSRPSRVMVNVDLKQAESNVVAHITGDEAYIAAHATGDVHTAVAMDLWGEGAPTDPAERRKWLRDEPFFLGKPRRHLAKSAQHGTNYGLEPAHASRMLGCKLADAKALQARYFGKYAGVKARIDAMPARLKENHVMVSPVGRVHQYLGHPSDKHTVKGALADEPQGIVADILNVALYRIWREMDGRDLWLLNQNYDSILFECERSQVDRVTERVRELMRVRVPIGDRVLVLDSDIGVGENWKEASA